MALTPNDQTKLRIDTHQPQQSRAELKVLIARKIAFHKQLFSSYKVSFELMVKSNRSI